MLFKKNNAVDSKKQECSPSETETLYKALVETTNTGYVIIDKDGKVIDANKEYVRLTGHNNLDEIRGRSVIEWTAGYEKEKNAEAVAQCAKDGYIRNLEIDYVDKNGKITPIEINATVTIKEGVPQIITLCRDITERRKNEEQIRVLNEQILTILDSSPSMIFYKDKENRFIRVNEALAKANNKPKQEMEGKTCWDLYPKEAADHYWQDDKEVMAAGKPKLNIVESMETSTGTMWVQTDKIPYRDSKGKIIGIVGFTLDITERKQMEDKLKNALDVSEQANKLMVGREMEMVKLKEKIKELEGKATN